MKNTKVSFQAGLLKCLSHCQKAVAMVAVSVVLAASSSDAGNGIERTSAGVDFSRGSLSSVVQEAARSALTERCGGALDSADSVTLINVSTKILKVDQGLEDAIHTLTFVFEADSLPRRTVVVVINEFDILSSRASADVESVRGIVCN